MFNIRQNNFFNIIKWLFFSSVIGVVVGTVDAGFLKALDYTLHWRDQFPLYYLGLPFFLYITFVVARKFAKHDLDYTTDAVIEKINTYRPVGWKSALKSLLLSIFTMATGGSVGKEAPGADAGAGVSSCLAALFRMNKEDRHKLMICGVSAGFAGVFGVPLSGALFGLEVLWVGHIFYEVMLPAFIAGITAFQITTYWGVSYVYHPLNFVPVFSEKFFLKVIIAGLFFGLVSIALSEILRFVKVLFRYISVRFSPFWRSFVGGTILVLIGFFISTEYLSLGMEGFNHILAGGELTNPFGFLIKCFTTAITLAAGGVGGIITPVFFIGAQAGATLSSWLGTDSATLAALGLTAVLAGAANTPLAASIMAIELFGAPIAPYATIACVISFLMSGRHSIYANQRISFDKQKAAPVTGNLSQADRMSARKGLLLKTFKEMSKHLVPNPKGFDKEKKDDSSEN